MHKNKHSIQYNINGMLTTKLVFSYSPSVKACSYININIIIKWLVLVQWIPKKTPCCSFYFVSLLWPFCYSFPLPSFSFLTLSLCNVHFYKLDQRKYFNSFPLCSPYHALFYYFYPHCNRPLSWVDFVYGKFNVCIFLAVIFVCFRFFYISANHIKI